MQLSFAIASKPTPFGQACFKINHGPSNIKAIKHHGGMSNTNPVRPPRTIGILNTQTSKGNQNHLLRTNQLNMTQNSLKNSQWQPPQQAQKSLVGHQFSSSSLSMKIRPDTLAGQPSLKEFNSGSSPKMRTRPTAFQMPTSNLHTTSQSQYGFKTPFQLRARASVVMQATLADREDIITKSKVSTKAFHEELPTINGISEAQTLENFMDLHFDKGKPQKMGSAGNLKDMVEFPQIFTTGGDQALPLDPVKGHNKFFIKPFVEKDSLIRSSCTSAPPTVLGYNSAKYHYKKLQMGETNVDEIMDGIRNEIIRLYDLPNETGIILTPSRYDAQYIPILIARALNEDKQKIVNIITAKNELGDCTIHAAGGRYFSEQQPFDGYSQSKPEELIAGLSLNVEVQALDTRAPNGDVINHNQTIEEILSKCQQDESVPILHSIYGSATGVIKNYISMKQIDSQSDFSTQVNELGGIMVANCNQGRLEKEWLIDLVDQDVVVITSGSRFFRGPSHSGAVIIPPAIMQKLKQVDANVIKKEWGGELVPSGLNGFFGKQNFPKELKSWRAAVEDNQNPGLALRWIAALAEMEPTLAIDQGMWWSAKMGWRSQIINDLLYDYPVLQFLEDRADTQSILSVTVLNRETNSTLSTEELEIIYEAMTMDLSDKFDWNEVNSGQASTDKDIQLTINKLYDQQHWENILKYICYIGRPIKFSDTEGLLRISLDSESFRGVVDDIENDRYINIIDDEIIVKKMAFLAQNYTQLKRILGKDSNKQESFENISQEKLASILDQDMEQADFNQANQTESLQREISEIHQEIKVKEEQIQKRLQILQDQGLKSQASLEPSELNWLEK